jgi:hypothetical protein
MLREADGRSWVMKCVLCGQEVSVETTISRPAVNGTEAAAAIDWVAAARARLAALVQEVAAVEVKKQEAERIHRALTAAEVERIPELPWMNGQPWRNANGASKVRFNTCVRCGKKLGPGESTRDGGIHGPYVCRTGCPAVATEAA